jgi:hypothetical protein
MTAAGSTGGGLMKVLHAAQIPSEYINESFPEFVINRREQKENKEK